MSLACPECGAPAPRGVRPGKAYPCPRCRNPVLAVEPKPAPPPAPEASGPSSDDSQDAAAPPAPRRSGFSWPWALAAFVVLGAAYVGAYELLTAEAKRERAHLERLRGPEIATFPPPGPIPERGVDAAWNTRNALYRERQTYEARGRFIGVIFGAMAIAFGLQTAVTVVLGVRTLSSARARARLAEREALKARPSPPSSG